MTRSKSSHRWLREHFDDTYVQRARREGLRSRAAYKLLELQGRYRLMRPGDTVVDLGAAPGGWSQVAAGVVGNQGRVVACDLLPMDSVAGVDFVAGDFTEQAVYERLLDAVGRAPVDLVISDMAPNLSGNAAIDQPRAMELAELAFELAGKTLRQNGALVVKLFQGEGFDAFLRAVRDQFSAVRGVKPAASRPRSREQYLVATGFRREVG
ncbi:MAG: 23S rRNA (uridine(2552)-2'-O)-methyltransferase RlmE [Pseudomonadota bacterium]|nr:23S rRNA (uridine(2552)-2'-O)-methyltransferase RlmE [Pseudomonadota bacterium]